MLVLEDERSDFNPHPLKRRLLITLQEAPDLVCGIASRVGWIQYLEFEHPIYRLKVRLDPADRKRTTLPGFFVLEQGVFVAYLPPDPSPESRDACLFWNK